MGLFGKIAAPVYGGLRATIPALEALAHAGNQVLADVAAGRYVVELRTPPPGIELCLVGHGAEQGRALRMQEEPPYPDEWEDGVAWWERGSWAACPSCGRALVWCEAGFVPGMRVCLAGHACRLSSDGRRVVRQRRLDSSVRRAVEQATGAGPLKRAQEAPAEERQCARLVREVIAADRALSRAIRARPESAGGVLEHPRIRVVRRRRTTALLRFLTFVADPAGGRP